ncbi:ester cyclase [Amycolatopsis saalfeldensis]|uniref:Predicted ester cyclase n=1 Tax=Amycolatopsis saalfeldensis TaxID=394193 RepID=A0A1H8XIR2_9PSEU|nr:ester cyclase [Amycolatopsis saalfeldensis]SEP39651.1 Predicted ester cyclase [Amycolatopsis saalfeldensis]
MSTESADVALMRAFVEQVHEGGRIELIEDFVHADFRNRSAKEGRSDGREGVVGVTRALHAAFEGLKVEIVHCVETDGVVATHKIYRGRHVGLWLGAPPSGLDVEFRVMDFVRVRDGRFVEHWSVLEPPRGQ